MKDILLKGIDENVWYRLKAVSSLNKRTVSEELNIIIEKHTKKELKKQLEDMDV